MADIKLLQGDCLELLKDIPDKSIDLILTDPPYECENHGGGSAELAQRDLVKNLHIDFMSNGFAYDSVFSEFLRICRTPNCLIFCSNSQISTIMSWFEAKSIPTTLLVWYKENPIPLCNGKYLSDCEFIVYVHGKGATFNDSCPFEFKHKLYSSPIVPANNRFHPAQKPIELLEQYILLHSNSSATILDPFMGSGSTAIACYNTDRNFIGMELNKDYYHIAEQRLEAAKHGRTPVINKDTVNSKKLF